MRLIPIEAVPNQAFTINIDGTSWSLRIKAALRIVTIDVYRNNEALLLGQRISVGTPIIPYRYLSGSGNFVLIVENDELPNWESFGSSQQLLFVEAGELAEELQYNFTQNASFVQVFPVIINELAVNVGA